MLAQLSSWLYLAVSTFCLPATTSPTASPDHCYVADLSRCVSKRSDPSSPPPSPAASACLNGIINDYTPVLGFGCDSSTLQVGTLTGFSPGDKVLLLQMQVAQVDLSNTASFGSVLTSACIGNYEFNRIQSMGGNTIQLQYALTTTYDVSGKVQLVRVPEYDSATVCYLTCLPWNGSVGGVLVLDVQGPLTLTGNIDVSGRGFRGGIVETNLINWVFGETQYAYPPQSTLAGPKGEGITLIPTNQSYGRGRAGNGGGGGNAHNGGGGGGGNGSAGGDGGWEIVNLPAAPLLNTNGIGGERYFENNPHKYLLGGGAGAGHANDNRGTSGGNGGGIAIVLANTLLTNNFRVLANGVDVVGGFDQNDGQGGGGAGGTVLLKIGQLNGALPCELRGGRGGSNPYNQLQQLHGPGGGGSGGKLLLTQSTPGIIPSLQGGANGLTSQNFSHGSQPGASGQMLVGFPLPEGSQPTHPVSNQFVLAVQSLPCSNLANGQIAVLQSTALAFRLNGGPWQPDSIFTGLTAGSYHIGLQFSGGCTLDTTAVLTATPSLRDTLLWITNPSCTGGGSLGVGALEGTAPFEFQLNGGPWQATGTFNNLSPGNYTLTVRDAVGCTHASTYAVDAPLSVQGSLISLTDAGCTFGGAITTAAVSGVAPFEFRLDNGPWQTSGTFTNLPPGQYTITIRDNAGCTYVTAYTVAMTPPVLDSLVSIYSAGCTFGGAITTTAISGTAPFEYQLDSGPWQATGAFVGLSPGDYTVTLRDSAGCTHSSTYSVGVLPPAINSLVLLNNAGCISGGSITTEAVFGTPPFEYSLNNGPWQANGVFTNLSPGDYTVTLRDSAGCISNSIYAIEPPQPALDSLIASVDAGCAYGGSLRVAIISGAAPYEFQLNGGPWQPNGSFTDLPPGDYTVTLRDAVGCTHTSIYPVAAPPPVLDTLLSLTDAGCTFGGSLTVGAISGTPPFEFQLNNGPWQADGAFTDLQPGSYVVTLRDSAGCTISGTHVVAAPPSVQDSLLVLINAGCTAGGGLAVTAVAGTAPFEYQLDNGPWQASGVFLDLPAGMYTVALRDAVGCTHSATYTVAPSPPVLDSLLALVGAGCTFDGGLAITAVSGTAPFAYQLDNGPWQASGVFWDLPAGSYTVTVRDTAGCTHTSTHLVAAPLPARDSLVALVEASCIAPGGLVVAAVSGKEPFEFQLNNGPWQASGVFWDLPAGAYLLTLRDSAGCTDTSTYVVAAPDAPLDSLVVLVNPGCTIPGGLVVAAVAGQAPFTFQLNNGPAQESGVFWNLTPGPYTVTLRDSNGCTHTSSHLIEPPPPVLDSLLVLINAGCTFGGSITVEAVSGTAPFEFQLDNGPWQTSGHFAGLPSGSYTVTLRDTAGCTHTSNYVVSPPPPPQDSLLALAHAGCTFAGSLSVAAVSGTAPFEFQLDNGPWQPDGTFTNLLPGTYTVTLRDSAGCTYTSNYVIEPPPPALDSLLSLTDAGCTFGGTIAVGAVSGTAPFEFQLDNGPWQPDGTFTDLLPDTYTVTLRDSAGCTHTSTHVIAPPPPALDSLVSLVGAGCSFGGSLTVAAVSGTPPFEFQVDNGPWQPNGVFTGLPSGAHTVTLRDSAGCTYSSTHVIAPPLPVLDSLVTLDDPSCTSGGRLVVAAVSGLAPFEFQLDNGPWQPSGAFTDLLPGTYTVTLRDSAGCTHTSNHVLTPPPPVLDSLVSLFNAGCTFGGSIEVAPASGTAPFEFQLNNGPWQANGIFPNLPPGSYELRLRDAAGCSHLRTYVVAPPPPLLDSLVLLTNPSCQGDGSLRVVAISGTPPYQYQLNGEPWQSSGHFTDLGPGEYEVTLRDSAGCMQVSSYIIAPYEPLQLRLDSLGDVDCRHPGGFIAVTATGGSGDYRYGINNGSSPQSDSYFPDLPANIYDVVVTDAAGCTAQLVDLQVADLVDSVVTRETVTIYEGAFFELPDGRRVGRAGQYPLHWLTTEGCDSLHIIDLIVLERNVYVPNVFRPNDDGENDFLSVFSNESLAVVRRFTVHDRWGELLFEKRDMLPNQENEGWDGQFRGRPVNAGVYVWVAELEFVDGVRRTIWGDVTVLR